MQLVRVSITKYRRFEKASVAVDARVLAFVGPNEAGKSSLFEALSDLDEATPIPKSAITRGVAASVNPGDDVIEARYLLDAEERMLASEYGAAEEPRWYIFSKQFNGKRTHTAEPVVRRDKSRRRATHDYAKAVLSNPRLARILSVPIEDTEESLKDSLMRVCDALGGAAETLSDDVLESVSALVTTLDNFAGSLSKSAAKAFEKLSSKLKETIASEKRPHPSTTLLKALEARRPHAYLFSEEDRQLLPD